MRGEKKVSRLRRILAGLAIYLALEAFYLPETQLSGRAAVGLLHVYQATLSKLFRATGSKCKFEPSCSRYSEGAIVKYGTLPGIARTAARIWRCSPWGPPPGEDLP